MTPEQRTVFDIRAHIETLPHEWQKKLIHQAADDLRAWLRAKRELGRVAMALVGAEIAAQIDEIQ